jgi:hypothetical protein
VFRVVHEQHSILQIIFLVAALCCCHYYHVKQKKLFPLTLGFFDQAWAFSDGKEGAHVPQCLDVFERICDARTPEKVSTERSEIGSVLARASERSLKRNKRTVNMCG